VDVREAVDLYSHFFSVVVQESPAGTGANAGFSRHFVQIDEHTKAFWSIQQKPDKRPFF